MTDDDPFEVVDPSGLSDADWAEINKLQQAYKEGGKRALNRRWQHMPTIRFALSPLSARLSQT